MNRATIFQITGSAAFAAILVLASAAIAVGDGGQSGGAEGAVFVLTNSTDADRGNEVVLYERSPDGSLVFRSSHATGGLGSGPAPTSTVFGLEIPMTADGIGSQDSLILSDRRGGSRQLFAVNSGSNSVTCFLATPAGLKARQIVDSGGEFPASLALHKNTLYVLNVGGVGNIQGFHVRGDCRMKELPGSGRSLAAVFDEIDPPFPSPTPNEVLTTPAQISFTPDGKLLVISIKGGPPGFDGGVAVFGVLRDGRLEPDPPTVTAFSADDSRAGPFGFVFDSVGNVLLMHVNSFTMSSYQLGSSRRLVPIGDALPISALGDGSVLEFSAFNCWVTRSGETAYVMSYGDIPATNGGLPDGPGVISAVRIAADGNLSTLEVNDLGGQGVVAVFPQDDRNVTGGTLFGNHGIDLTTIEGREGKFLYAVQPRLGKIGIWSINDDGTLTDLGSAGGLAPGVDPFAGTNPGISNFLERCFNQEGDRDPECALGSAQGVVGF